MPSVWIPALLRHLTHDQETVQVAGATVRALIDGLEARYPGIKARLCHGDALRPGLAVVIDAQVARSGLDELVDENSEVHFIPAIGGGIATDKKRASPVSGSRCESRKLL